MLTTPASSCTTTTAPCCCNPAKLLKPLDEFAPRHLGPSDADVKSMLKTIAAANGIKRELTTLDDLVDVTVPKQIRLKEDLPLGDALSETEALATLKNIASKNKVLKSFIGQGYTNCILPTVILRNVLENPAWYTPYTPYQAEIAQGRLEAMLNFQTVISDLTGLSTCTCSLLDEATSAAEAMFMAVNISKGDKKTFLVDENIHSQTLEVMRTRAEPQGIKVVVGKWQDFEITEDVCGAFVQYPASLGSVEDYSSLADKLHKKNAVLVCSADLLALTLLRSPSEFGADIVVGSAGRFGAPVGYGGPHAGFLVTKKELQRVMPGRIIGISRDKAGGSALRMALQTREQHIRRERATSNICTASALLCDIAGFYAVYHGPEGLKKIAKSVHAKAAFLNEGLKKLGFKPTNRVFFDTVHVPVANATQARAILDRAQLRGINLRDLHTGVSVTFDETTTLEDVANVLQAFAGTSTLPFTCQELVDALPDYKYGEPHARQSAFLRNKVFNEFHSEHEMLRYLYRLQLKDIGLNQHMIPLGSCTMKLNPTSSMIPITWPEFANIHPFAPASQTEGYATLCAQLEDALAKITGFKACSLQPNSGAAGEYAGLMTMRNYLKASGQEHRNVCLIPVSAHGTNPASAVMAGFKIVTVACDPKGNVDIKDLETKAKANADKLGALMITYPSTHGVYEEGIKDIIKIIHANGGLVYMDGANMNAQVGLTSPGTMGADVCHLNLHKTFAIPHGGGGPGMGPICCTEQLAPYLPGHQTSGLTQRQGGAVSGSQFGSGSILPISWMYIYMLGAKGVKKATQVAILNANYMAARLKEHYPIVYTGPSGMCAHEFIMDTRQFKHLGIEAEDIAKRLMDFGFHGPTMSFPVPNTLMVEPTESESLAELDRLCDALIAIRGEIRAVEEGRLDKLDNPLKNAPHTAAELTATEWKHKYTREQAAFPADFVRGDKYWVPVKRIDNTYGDLHLQCTRRADE